MNQIARVSVRFFKKYDIVHGTFARFMSEDGLFTQYKRFWYPAGYYKDDGDRIVVTSECAFVVITAIGVEEIGVELGEMDMELTLGTPFEIEEVVNYSKSKSLQSDTFIALFHKEDNGFVFDGEININRAGELLYPKKPKKQSAEP